MKKQLPPSYENKQLPPSYEDKQLPPSYKNKQLPPSYEKNTCPQATRENSWRQQPRELRPYTERTTHTPKTTVDRRKYTKRGCQQENNIGVQTRDMAQWVDNESNPEQVQKTTDQATTPTIELHRTKEDAIKEFIREHGTINLDWYVPDLCNTKVGDLIEKRLQLGTTEGRILFSSPALNNFFKNIQLRAESPDRRDAYIP